MSKKRILFMMSRFLDGGIDTILLEYLKAIDPEKYDVKLVINIKMDDLEVHLAQVPEWVEVVYLTSAPWMTRVRKAKVRGRVSMMSKFVDEALVNPVRRLVARRRLKPLLAWADAVVDFDASSYTLLRSVKEKPVVGFYHFSIAENLKRSERHTTRQMQGMSGYKHIVVLSDVMALEGRELFQDLRHKFVRIYNGYDSDALRRRGAAEVPQIPSEPYVVSVCRLEESQKDVTTLLHAYRLLLDRWSQAPRLVLVGEGRDKAALQDLSAHLEIADKVDFMGFQPDAAPWIAHAEVLVLSSHYEGFGLVLVEAMILGRPVIATDCPTGPAEVLDNGRAGILVQPQDPQDLSEAIEAVTSNPDEAARLSGESLRRAETFDIKTSVKQLLDLL